MASGGWMIGCAGALVSLATLATAATVSGTVAGPDGSGFAGAFVQARNATTKITVSVLSDRAGHYRIENLPAGDYDIRLRAIGYDAAPKHAALAADQTLAFDPGLKPAAVKWSDLSMWQGKILLPEAKGKDVLFNNCFACHGFETRMAAQAPRSESDWRMLVSYMAESMHFFLGAVGRFTPEDEQNVGGYIATMFGPQSPLPQSAADMPKYDAVKFPAFSDAALKIVYVEYELPGPNRMPWSAFPDGKGNFWMPYYGDANAIGRLDPVSGEVREFKAPNQGTAAIHSAVPAPDGAVWLTEQGSNKLGRWDPGAQQITEYFAGYTQGKEGTLAGGSKHTLRVAPDGAVWATGGPLSKFDPKTGQFTNIAEIPSAYGIDIDRDSNIWFAEFTPNGMIGRIDPKTLHVTKWAVPTPKAWPRRIVVDGDGMVWFAEFQVGKIGRFDPKTETFREYPLPGAEPTPYALGIDRDHRVWYSSEHMDMLGRIDPATGEVTQYPIPQSENSMREFYLDAEGRMWFGSPSNNLVGYFYLAK